MDPNHNPNTETISQSTNREQLYLELNNFFIDENTEQSQFFNNATILIEKELANMKEVTEELNKMRERAAVLESMLLNKVSSSTWKDISELIGLSSANIIDDCFKIFDRHADGTA